LTGRFAQAPEAFWQTKTLSLKKHVYHSTENISTYKAIQERLWDSPSLLHAPSPQQQGDEVAIMQWQQLSYV